MIKFFINQSKSINLLTVFIILTGAYYFITGQKEGFPNIGFDIIVVSTPYPGASAYDVDRLVTKKLVDAIDQLEGKDEINASSMEGRSTIIFQVDSDAGIANDKIVSDIEKEIDLIKNTLPEDVEDSFVREITFQNGNPIIQVLFLPKEKENGSSSVAGKVSIRDRITKVMDEFEAEIAQFPGVGLTSRENSPDKEIWIKVDPNLLKKYSLDLSEVVNSIRNIHFNIPGGNIDLDNSEYLIKTINQFQSIDQIKEVILRSNSDGKVIKVKDIAQVEWNLEEMDILKRTRNKNAMNLQVFQQVNGDVITIGNKVKELIIKYNEIYPEVDMFFYDDLSFYVKRRLGVLSSNATIGLFLVFLCLLLFFDFKVTFWTTLGIPFSFCLAIIITYSMGVTLNLMSMFGFIIVIGMIVDDAIIVAENIYRRYEEGDSLYHAAIEGTREVFTPILAITATTVAAFLPLTTLPDIFGKVLGIIPIVVITTMVASFIECILVLPGHLAHLRDKREERRQEDSNSLLHNNEFKPNPEAKIEKRIWFQYVKNYYNRMITKVMDYPIITILGFSIITPGLMVILAMNVPVTFFPPNLERVNINVETAIDNSLDRTKNILDEVEVLVLGQLDDVIKDSITTVGSVENKQGGTRNRDYLGMIQFNLDISKELNEEDIIEKAETEIKKVEEIETYEISRVQGGPPPGNPVQVEIYINDLTQLEKISEEVKSYIETLSNTTSVAIGLEEGKKEILVNIDQVKTKLYRVDPVKVGGVIRSTFEGSTSVTANSIVGESEDIDIIVKMEQNNITNLDAISAISVKNQQNLNVPIDHFSSLSVDRGYGKIDRKEGRIYSIITAQLINDKSQEYNATVLNDIIKEKVADWKKKYPRVNIKLAGQKEEQDKLTKGGITAALMAIAGIFLILTTIFKSYIQPFIIMSILPFTIFGVLLGLFFTGHGIGLMPMLGLVALVGIVVNDSLVMVDFINRNRRDGMEKKAAIIKSATSRLRPILMTTITTVVGIGPLAYGIGGSEPFLEPMAVSLFWGLGFTTIIMLFFLPAVYSMIDSIFTFLYRVLFKRDFFTGNRLS